MHHFIRTFWLTGAVTAAFLVLVLHLGWSRLYSQMPARPALAALGDWGDSYVSDYPPIGPVDFYMLRYGIFGVGERLRRADVVIVGSSHPQVGLSAAQLSQELSTVRGKPVGVYNAGLGYGEGIEFTEHIMEGNRLENKVLIYDLFALRQGGIGEYGTIVEHNGVLGGYLKTLDAWLRAYNDWFLDPLLPRFHPQAGQSLRDAASPVRFLNNWISRLWSTGDIKEIWASKYGYAFGNPAAQLGKPFTTENVYHLKADGETRLDVAALDFFRQRTLSPIYTLVPFDGDQLILVSPEARPYIPISNQDVLFFDKMHVTAPSRQIVTQRLLDELTKLPPFQK